MIEIEIKPDLRFKAEMKAARRAAITASVNATDKMAGFVQHRARELAPKNTRLLEHSIHKTRSTFRNTSSTAHSAVVADVGYGALVETGFKSHFVPFHIAPSLYYEAIHKWGWRIPAPRTVKNARSKRLYLIPRGRSKPVWGVVVKGTPQPFMKPALDELFEANLHVRYLSEEFNKSFAVVSANSG